MKKWYESSTGQGLSLTIEGLSLGGLIVFLTFIFNFFGLDISENEIAELIQSILLIVSGAMTIVGLLRKLYFKFRGI